MSVGRHWYKIGTRQPDRGGAATALPIRALGSRSFPQSRLGLSVIAADRQQVTPETRALLSLVELDRPRRSWGLARRHAGLGFLWATIYSGLGLLSTLCICGRLWTDILRDAPGRLRAA